MNKIFQQLHSIVFPLSLALKSLTVVVAIGLTSISANAEISCRRLINGNARTFELEQAFATPESLLEAGFAVQKRASQIDPKTTYLPEYETAVKQVAAQIQIMLREKKGQALHKDRSTILMDIVKEIGERIQNKTITYEWAVALPLRVGFLSRMESEPRNADGMSIRTNAQTSYYYHLSTYQTHAGFMKAYEHATNFKPRFNERNRSRLKTDGDVIFKTFPEKIFIPTFMDLSIPQLNRLFEAKVLPIGMIRKKFLALLDGQTFNEHSFPIHDIFHGNNQEYTAGTTITIKLADFIESTSLQIADRSTGHEFDLIHLFHHLLFHESNRHLHLSKTTRSGVIDTIDQDIDGLLGRVITFNADTAVYSKELLKLSMIERGQLIREAHRKYIDALRAQIQENADFVDGELNKQDLEYQKEVEATNRRISESTNRANKEVNKKN